MKGSGSENRTNRPVADIPERPISRVADTRANFRILNRDGIVARAVVKALHGPACGPFPLGSSGKRFGWAGSSPRPGDTGRVTVG